MGLEWGTAAAVVIAVVTAVPATQWDVTASTGTGNGSLGLNLVNYTGLTHNITNAPFTGQVYTVDKTAPTVTNVTSTSNSGCLFNTGLTYCNAGDVIQVQITFSEAVDVTGTPQLALNSGGAAHRSSWRCRGGIRACVHGLGGVLHGLVGRQGNRFLPWKTRWFGLD